VKATRPRQGPDISIAALRARYAAGDTPEAVLAEVYDRVEASRGNLVWIHLVPRDAALARAREQSRGAWDRPLWGIPFAVKDNIDVEGLPTTAACPAYSYVAERSATAVAKLLDAGAILIGKTNLDQFATGLVGTRSPYGACRNAYDPRYISGGSSSGSAVAVALGLASFALGTDTAGSGRVPAAFNNLVGLKPTRGVVSTRGVVPACRTLDCVSVLAVTCADALDVLGVVEGFDPSDPYSREGTPVAFPAGHFRFAVPRREQLEFFGDAGYAALFDAAVGRLEALGGTAVRIDFAPFLAAQDLLYGGPWIAERVAGLGTFVSDHADELHPVTRRVLEQAGRFSAVDAFRAQYRLAELKRETDAVWKDAELLCVPSAPTIYKIEEVEASPIEPNARLGRYTNFVNLLDLAAVSVPAGFRPDGLPFGATLIGPAFSERALAALAARFNGEPMRASLL
jgi:allophanate hydrolase